MANVYADRVRETTATTGTGTYNLAGAVAGFQGFVAGVGTTNTCFYCVEDGTDWEVSQGTVTDAAPDTLSRDTIVASSNADAAVNWGAGSKKVFLVHPAQEIANIAVAASQAEQETGTEAAKYVAPATQQFHQSAAKFWCKYDGSAAGPITPDASYNVTDVTDNGAGVQTVNVATDFSGTDWAVAAISDRPNTDIANGGQAAGTVQVRTGVESGSSEFAASDATAVYVVGFGDQ